MNPTPINPRSVRLETATACQLKCPSCPTASGETGKTLGVGFLSFADFKKFIDTNREVSHIEISNWGEVFLNKDILSILQYAYEQNVAISAANGVNLNTVKPEVLRAVVQYRMQEMTCSIDGASQETYSIYRVKGNFDTVIANIRTINKWKAHYKSEYPKLYWQYVAFAHNEHEISKARGLAEELNMEFNLKLSWGDLYDKEFAPVKNKELIRQETGLDVADREEYQAKYGKSYITRGCCLQMWKQPQINIDGRLLGCCINYWGDYGNVFDEGLQAAVNNEKISYARDVLMGKKEARDDIPCSKCKIHAAMKKHDQWITESEITKAYVPSRQYVGAVKILGRERTGRLAIGIYKSKLALKNLGNPRQMVEILKNAGKRKVSLQNSGHAIPITTEPDAKLPWRSTHFFNGGSASCDFIQCHASSLIKGTIPHPPHAHKEEEILIMLTGEAEAILPDVSTEKAQVTRRLKAGDFVYYPAHFFHTLQAVSEKPANYLMFKWLAKAPKTGRTLGYQYHEPSQAFKEFSGTKDFSYKILFEGPTQCLKTLQGHVSVLQPGAGYEPHADPYDVALIILEGEVETLGKRYAAPSVIYYATGEMHGIRNCGSGTAKYVVFEFHG